MYFSKIYLYNTDMFELDWIYFFNNSENIFILSEIIYTVYFHIFLIAGIILLLAMIGTINITLYHASNVKRQLLYKQLGRTIISSITLKK